MAGTNANFDATAFRDAIHQAMIMGSPNVTGNKATFRWSAVRTYSKADAGGKPYDFGATPVTETLHADVVLDKVAVEFSARPAGSRDSAIGEFDTSRAVLTLLDDEQALVAGANEVLLGGNTYEVQFVGPPVALFEVDVYSWFLEARDES